MVVLANLKCNFSLKFSIHKGFTLGNLLETFQYFLNIFNALRHLHIYHFISYQVHHHQQYFQLINFPYHNNFKETISNKIVATTEQYLANIISLNHSNDDLNRLQFL